jgi:hypothetical protein
MDVESVTMGDLATVPLFMRRHIEDVPTKPLRRPRKPRLERRGYVYFIKLHGPEPCVKIGVTVGLDKRLAVLQWQSPYELELVGGVWSDACYRLERELHERFKDCRLRGEWFRLTPEIQEFVDKLS